MTENFPGSFYLSEKYEPVKSVRFSCNESDSQMFVVTASNGVVFGEWDQNQEKLLVHFPARSISITFEFNDTIFIEKSHNAISISECGCVIVWSDVLFCADGNSLEKFSGSSYRKEFIKSVKLSETPLRIISSVDNFVMICDELGHIRFYDQDLKIVFWTPAYSFTDSVVTIKFDLIAGESSEENLKQKFKVRHFFVRELKIIL